MANKRINDLQARSSADDTVNIAGDDASQTWRITLAQVKAYIRAAIAPLATLGDIIYGGTSGATTILAGNTTTTKKFLSQTGTGSASAAPAWAQPAYSDLSGWTAPTVQKFTSGSGTYTTPAGVKYIRVRAIGGGGGGGGGSTAGSPTDGGAGGNTTFGSTLLVANGGSGGVRGNSTSLGGAGGTASLGTGPIGTALTGASGGCGTNWNVSGTNIRMIAGFGAGSPFAGPSPGSGAASATLGTPVPNSGAGGGGGYGQDAAVGGVGGGGGAGGFIDSIIASPSATYAYAVGAAGAAGSAGTNGGPGSAGAAGYIEVTEYYQ